VGKEHVSLDASSHLVGNSVLRCCFSFVALGTCWTLLKTVSSPDVIFRSVTIINALQNESEANSFKVHKLLWCFFQSILFYKKKKSNVFIVSLNVKEVQTLFLISF